MSKTHKKQDQLTVVDLSLLDPFIKTIQTEI